MLAVLSLFFALFGIEWLDPEMLLRVGGVAALFIACVFVFLETGVFVLGFLPGDSLLFTVGLFSASGVIDVPVWVSCVLLFGFAFAGDQTGFLLGRRFGPAIFNRKKSRLFNPENVARTHAFFVKHGSKAVIIARFLPVFRAFVPTAAGVGRMSRKRFFVYNAVGAFLWAVGVTLLGFFLGSIPFVRKYSEVFILVLVFIPGIPILVELFRVVRSRLRSRGGA